ncbi:hypothetical protein [Kribbella deserti]|uniref:TrbL/VirB6 plasmid conjugal transfer protein n=1 Tax=Kribbella deserti TaxID=1926257 RepID=A0ABV6QSG2_9ACTN
MAWSDCILNPVGCTISKVGDSAAEAGWNKLTGWMARGLSDLSATVFAAFSTSTAPRFDQDWWTGNLALMVAISLPVLVIVVVLQCVSAVIRREPGGLGRALVGALIGTAGVPLAVGVVSMTGKAVDEMSLAILRDDVTADGVGRMFDLTVLLSAGSGGGFLLLAILLGLISLFGLYFVMLVREVALLAFVVFAPIALVSWTLAATRHWLRRWMEIVGALLFCKVAMAVIFTLGVSAIGASGQGNASNLGTFLGGTLLVAMAAFAPMATLSFLHWAGDQGHAAVQALQLGASGTAAAKEQVDAAQDWKADHFGGADADHDLIDPDGDTVDYDGADAGTAADGGDAAGQDDDVTTPPAAGTADTEYGSPPPSSGGDGDAGSPIAVATSNVVVNSDGDSATVPTDHSADTTSGRPAGEDD